jgi:hypothetical protein
MFCVSAVNTLHNEKFVAVPAQQAVTKSDSFPLIQTRGEGLPPEDPKQLLIRLGNIVRIRDETNQSTYRRS